MFRNKGGERVCYFPAKTANAKMNRCRFSTIKCMDCRRQNSFLLFCRFSVLSNSERIVASFGGHVASRFYPLEGLIIIIIIIIIVIIIIIIVIIIITIITIIIKNQIYTTLKYKIF